MVIGMPKCSLTSVMTAGTLEMGEVPMVASLASAIPSAMQMRPANMKMMRSARLAVGFEKKRCQEIANVLLLMFTCIVDESSRARYSSPISKNETVAQRRCLIFLPLPAENETTSLSNCLIRPVPVFYRGTRMVKVVRPSLLVASMLPPWATTISLAMARPSPAPPVPCPRAASPR